MKGRQWLNVCRLQLSMSCIVPFHNDMIVRFSIIKTNGCQIYVDTCLVLDDCLCFLTLQIDGSSSLHSTALILLTCRYCYILSLYISYSLKIDVHQIYDLKHTTFTCALSKAKSQSLFPSTGRSPRQNSLMAKDTYSSIDICMRHIYLISLEVASPMHFFNPSLCKSYETFCAWTT